MKTAEMLDFETKWGRVGDVQSVYRGPSSDRLSLRDAAAQRMLVFSVNRSYSSTPIGQQSVIGFYEDFDAAVDALRNAGRGWRISAHHRGFGHTEECLLYCSYWKPLGELGAA